MPFGIGESVSGESPDSISPPLSCISWQMMEAGGVVFDIHRVHFSQVIISTKLSHGGIRTLDSRCEIETWTGCFQQMRSWHIVKLCFVSPRTSPQFMQGLFNFFWAMLRRIFSLVLSFYCRHVSESLSSL